MKKKNQILLYVRHPFGIGQDFKIQFSHIPIGQGIATKDSVKIVNSIGGAVFQKMLVQTRLL